MSDLSHYGVKGMKWGVRKNKPSTSRKAKSREAKTLSNEELQKRIKRIELESRYVALTSKPTTIDKGKKVAGNIIGNIGKQLASDALKKGTRTGTKLVVKKLTGG